MSPEEYKRRARDRVMPVVLAVLVILALANAVVGVVAKRASDRSAVNSGRVERGLCVLVKTLEATELRERKLKGHSRSVRARELRRLSHDLRDEVRCAAPPRALLRLRP